MVLYSRVSCRGVSVRRAVGRRGRERERERERKGEGYTRLLAAGVAMIKKPW
jgi:hypothetical protein